MSKVCLVTGSSGLIGSEVAGFFHARGFAVHGVDNNQRETFFGPQGNTRWNQQRLATELARFTHHELDIRNRPGVAALVKELRPAVICYYSGLRKMRAHFPKWELQYSLQNIFQQIGAAGERRLCAAGATVG